MDYTEPKYVEAELRSETSFSTSTFPSLSDVRRWISEESKLIDLKTGTNHGYVEHVNKVFDYNGGGLFRFPESEIVSVTTLEYRNVNGTTWTTLEQGYNKDYIIYTETGEIEFLNGKVNRGSQVLRINYISGSYEVPLHIQRLCTLMVAKRVIMSLANNQSNAEGGSIQVGTIRITDPTNYSVNWIKSVNEEIKNIYSMMGDDLKVFRHNRVYD